MPTICAFVRASEKASDDKKIAHLDADLTLLGGTEEGLDVHADTMVGGVALRPGLDGLYGLNGDIGIDCAAIAVSDVLGRSGEGLEVEGIDDGEGRGGATDGVEELNVLIGRSGEKGACAIRSSVSDIDNSRRTVGEDTIDLDNRVE